MDWTEYDVFLKYRYWLGKYIPKNMQDEAKEYFMTCEECHQLGLRHNYSLRHWISQKQKSSRQCYVRVKRY